MEVQIFLEYVGFTAAMEGREYRFLAREGEGEARQYTVTIANEVFASRRAKYQDGPAISFTRLRREFEKASKHPATTCFSITVAEFGGSDGPSKEKARVRW